VSLPPMRPEDSARWEQTLSEDGWEMVGTDGLIYKRVMTVGTGAVVPAKAKV
ncbi:hypothetical protein KIPB_013303, partial [Kipferlia bialata]